MNTMSRRGRRSHRQVAGRRFDCDRVGRGHAGNPDPGSRLVAQAYRQSIRVQPIPGPSAVLAAVSATGFTGDGFLFAGFPPFRSNARKKWLREFSEVKRPVVLLEAPHRILATLEDIAAVLGNREVAIGRELT